MEKHKRNSSIELLRILCIWGIVFMHTIAYGGDKMAEYNRIMLIFVNCFTNMGVTCFMLISGYFGIKCDFRKLIKLDMMVILYTFARFFIRMGLHEELGIRDLLGCFFPIMSNQYWYLTAYFIIAIISGYLNCIPEVFSKCNFQKLLVFGIFLFWVIPTVLHYDLLGSEGKNVVSMAIIYLIGRYIRKYGRVSWTKGKLAGSLIGTILLIFALEMVLYVVTGHYSMFYRDCSVFTLIASVLLFLIFNQTYFESKIVNKIASAVLAVYVFSFGFQKLIYLLIPLENYAFSPMLFPLICIFAPCVVIGCIVIELFRQRCIGRIEDKMADKLVAILEKGKRKLWESMP